VWEKSECGLHWMEGWVWRRRVWLWRLQYCRKSLEDW
jgi:hypothetical protein